MSRKPYAIAVIILTLTILTTYVSEIIFKDLKDAVIAGLVVAVLSTLFEARLAIESSSEKFSVSSKEATDRLAKLLKFHNEYFHDQWLLDRLEDIVGLYSIAAKQSHDLSRFRRILTESLDRAKKEMGQAFTIMTGDNELERNMRLRDAVAGAHSYIYAVTFDARDYLDRFWDKVFGEEYAKSNIRAAKKGVKIKRIFVVSRSTLTNSVDEKRQKLSAVIRTLGRAGKNMEIYIAAIEDLPESMRAIDTSFLVADDYVGSESEGLSSESQIPGYVTYGDVESVIEPLKERFHALLPYARPARSVIRK